MRKRWSEWLGPGIILALYLVLGCLYAVFTPPWQAPDEPAHYNYVRHLAEYGRLPVLHFGDYPQRYLEELKAARFPREMSIAPLCYESWQPPLYYVLAAPLYRLFQGDLMALRLFSVLLGGAVVAVAYVMLCDCFPAHRATALGSAAFVAFVPMHLAVCASVNNDVLAELLIVLTAWRAMACIARPERCTGWKWQLHSGILLGLGLLTKLTYYYVALPLLVLGLWWQQRNLLTVVRRYAAMWGVALLLAIPWYLRNVALYGWPDLLGKLHHDAVVIGQLRTVDHLAQVGWIAYLQSFLSTTFQSFWGQFGWMAVPMDARTYLLLGILSALAVLGGALALWERTRRQSCAAGITFLAAWLALTVVGYLYYNVTFVQFQGRYLFPGLVPLGLFAVTGWRTILTRCRAWLGAGAAGVIALGGAAADASRGGLDKWELLLGLAVTAALAVRRGLPQGWDAWLWTLPLIILAGIAGYSVFAFIVPHL